MELNCQARPVRLGRSPSRITILQAQDMRASSFLIVDLNDSCPGIEVTWQASRLTGAGPSRHTSEPRLSFLLVVSGSCARADQVRADLPEPGRGGLVVAALRRTFGLAVGEVLARDVFEIGG